MSSSPVIYTPCPDAAPEQARDIRARAWRYVFYCHEKKNAAGVTSADGDDDYVEGEDTNDSKPRP